MRHANYRNAKSNTQLFESLLNKDYLRIIENNELIAIKGGDPTAAQIATLVDNLFTTSPIFVQQSGLSATLWNIFKTQVEALASTNIGYDLLTKLDTENKQIRIDPFALWGVEEGGASWRHDGTGALAGGKVEIGSMFTDYGDPTSYNYMSEIANNFGTVAHELFHAYVYIKTNVWQRSTPNIEMDAELFSFMACAEMDGKRSISSLNYIIGPQFQSYVSNEIGRAASIWNEVSGVPASQVALYKDALWEMFHDGNFNFTNYNALAGLFATTSAVANGSTSQGVADEAAFNNLIIKSFWSNSYSQSTYYANFPPLFLYTDPIADPPPPGNGGSGGGGGFDPYYYGWTYDSGIGQYGGWQSGSWFTSFYISTGGQSDGGGFDWDSFWYWLNSWSGTNWGIVGDVMLVPIGSECQA